MRSTSVTIPTLVPIKPGALDRLGVYAQRSQFQKVVLLFNKELDRSLIERVEKALAERSIDVLKHEEVQESSFEHAQEVFQSLPQPTEALIGFGGGKALDVAKYVAFLSRQPYIAVPTALSNDSFCSPQASLEFKGKRRTFSATMPYGVVIDSEICLNAPRTLWLAGIGDLLAKITAIYGWKKGD